MTRAFMIQGAGSNVGKSMLVAGLCRAYGARGLNVAPFKPQNMSNNAAVTVDGGEIGRAQALQARACGLPPHSDMNPVLLKPETETGAQVIVQGRRLTSLKARDYGALKPTLMPRVLESFHRLAAGADLVIVEGAGSPAEVNLRGGDIANMGFAEAAGVNVILVGDIDRGGVIAQLVGSHAVLEPADRDRIKGFMVNKFRGEPSLFAEGAAVIARATGWADMGLIPWFADAWRLPAEDILDLGRAPRGNGAMKIAVLQLSRIANFDDLDPLAAQEGVDLTILRPGQALPGDIDLVILPGSKSTIGDLADLRAFGWDIDLLAHHRRGGRILGICGGYQMLGRRISDPDGVEGAPSSVPGLGFLDVETVMRPQKRLAEVTGQSQGGHAVAGYEIHMGETHGPDCARPMMQLFDSETGLTDHGAQSRDGRVGGCYLHGLFASDGFRAAYLGLGDRPATDMGFEDSVEATLDALADHMAQHVDLDHLLTLAGEI